MSQRRFKAKMRRLKQKKQRKEKEKADRAWKAMPFKTRMLLFNIGYDPRMVLVFWMSCRKDKMGLKQMLEYLVRGHSRVWNPGTLVGR